MATNKVRGVVRDPLTGDGVASATVHLKKHNGGTDVTTDGTDANGLYEMDNDTVGYPGPVYAEVTVGSTTKRQDGNVWGQAGGLVWMADIPDALSALGIGVAAGMLSDLAVTADGLSMNVSLAAGVAILKDGCPYVQETAKTLAIGAADGSNPRIDYVVLRLTREGQTDQGKIARTVIAGTPAGSPVAPTLTQSSSVWDLPLATVLVGTGVTVIASNKVTDVRDYCISESRIATAESSLAGKAALAHTHPESDVTSLVTDLSTLTSAVAGKAATGHTHSEGDVTSLTSDLAGKASSTHTHSGTDITGTVAFSTLPETVKTFTLGTGNDPTGSPDASTTSTSTYATAFTDTTSVVLPAGTWRVTGMGGCAFINSGSGKVAFYLEIDGTGTLTLTPNLSATVYSWWMDHATQSVVSNGSTAIVVSIRYRSQLASTTTPAASKISLSCVRTA